MNKARSTAVTFVMVLALSACSQKTAQEYLASAQSKIAGGEKKAAVVELKNALSQAPDLGIARFLLGQLYFEQNDFVAAEKELLRAFELGAELNQTLPLLAKTYYYQGDYGKVITLYERQLPTSESAQQTLHLFAYIASLRLSSEPSAWLAFPASLTSDNLLIAKAYKALIDGNPEQAESVVGEFSEPGLETEKSFLKALVAFRLGQFERAATHYNQVLKAIPDLHPVRFQLVEAQINGKDYEGATDNIDLLLSLNKGNPYANLLKAKLDFVQQRFESALPFSEKAIQNGMDIKLAQIIAGVSAFKLNQFESAYRYLKRAASDLGKGHAVHRLLAQVQLMLGYTDEARLTLDEMNILGESDAGLFAEAGRKMAEQGDLYTAGQYLAKASKADSDNAEFKLTEGLIKLAGNDHSGVADIETALKGDASLQQGWVVLAETYLDQEQTDKALDVARQWQQSDAANGLTLEGVIYQNSGNLAEADSAFRKALEQDKHHLGANHYLVQLYRQQGKPDQALEQIEHILTFAPENMMALSELVRLKQQTGQQQDIIPWLTSHQDSHPELTEPRLVLAEYLRTTGQPLKAIDILDDESQSLPAIGGLILGDAYIQLGRYEEAKAVLEPIRDSQPEMLGVWLRTAGIEEVSGNFDKALSLINQALERFPQNSLLMLLKVNYLTRLGQSDDARQILSIVRDSDTDSGLLDRLEGELALSEGRYSHAERKLRDYYKAEPNFESASLLAIALQNTDKLAEATKILEAEFAKLSSPRMEFHTLAEFYIHNEMPAQAEQKYRQFLQRFPGHVLTLNNYASLKIKQQQYAEALPLAKQAHQAASQIPQIQDTLGWLYFKTGDLDSALPLLKSAAGELSDDAEVQMNFAEALMAQGDNREAFRILQSITGKSERQRQRLQDLKAKVGGMG